MPQLRSSERDAQYGRSAAVALMPSETRVTLRRRSFRPTGSNMGGRDATVGHGHTGDRGVCGCKYGGDGVCGHQVASTLLELQVCERAPERAAHGAEENAGEPERVPQLHRTRADE